MVISMKTYRAGASTRPLAWSDPAQAAAGRGRCVGSPRLSGITGAALTPARVAGPVVTTELNPFGLMADVPAPQPPRAPI